jgi:hypothetical protein
MSASESGARISVGAMLPAYRSAYPGYGSASAAEESGNGKTMLRGAAIEAAFAD